ncbi:MAG: hypothetical protein HYX44_10500 [Aquabacterium sp.]|nr:hypothetical protein [Aquabacterium sp.]
MIHHLARAFFIRNTTPGSAGENPPPEGARPASVPAARPVKARPITPWGAPARQPGKSASAQVIPLRASAPARAERHVRICTDPADARRTVIAGRFAEVCAALDRLVLEQEAAA